MPSFNDGLIDHRDEIINNLVLLLKKGSFDVQIILSDGIVVADSAILSSASDYFATMISNEKFIEGQTKNIVMKDYGTQKAMESIVEYVYSGKMNLSTAGTSGRGLAQLMATIKNQE